ncbi:MAG: FHA domain-containing protein, partial [Nannocystaceae bacterium]
SPAAAVTGMTAPHEAVPAVTGQTLPPSAAPASADTSTTQAGPRRGRKDPRASGLRLVMLGAKGEAVAERTLATGGSLDLGRDPGEPWADDEYIEPRHVRLTAIDGGCSFQELVPTGAVFLRVQGRARMRDGDQLRVGQSLLAYDRGDGDPNAGPWGRVVVHHAADGSTHAVPLGGAGVMVGRELGEVTLPGDTFVSSTHCRVGCDQNGVFVEDLESSNGTYLRLRSGDRVDYGACVLVGQTQFMLRKR